MRRGGFLVARPQFGWKNEPMREASNGVLRRCRKWGMGTIAVGVAMLVPLAVMAQDEVLSPVPTGTVPDTRPVPLSDVPARAIQVLGVLSGIEEGLRPAREILAIEGALDVTIANVAQEEARSQDRLANRPTSDVLAGLASTWGVRVRQLEEWGAALQQRSRALEQSLDTLATMDIVWAKTGEEALQAGAPAVILSRIEEVRATIRSVLDATRRRRGEILTAQETVGALGGSATSVLAGVGRARKVLVTQLLERQSGPVWTWADGIGETSALGSRAAESFSSQVAAVRQYLYQHSNRALLHLIATALVALWLVRGRRRAAKWVEEEPALKSVTEAFSIPGSTAVLLSLVAVPWVNPLAPTALVQLAGLVALFPAVRLLKRICPPTLLSGLYWLSAFYLLDRFRSFFTASETVAWSIFVVEMTAALLLSVRLLAPGRLEQLGWPEGGPGSRWLAGGRRLLATLFSVAVVATCLGYVRLGGLVGDGALASCYAALLLYASGEALNGLWTYALRSRVASKLRFVRDFRWLLQQRGHRAVSFLLLGAWAVVTLRSFALLAPLLEFCAEVLGARFSQGNLNLSLGDVVLFVVSVWGAMQLSRFLRFVLEQDVYGRAGIAHGASYALSTLLHYFLVVSGFLLGIAAVGFDMSRFAIVAGALSVGIGFGLQAIVNNFVSGLILLFERPVQVGDAVEVGTLSGEVRRIGIRSSTIRTWDGAEVIVPNGSLISDTVTNWTLSDRMKRIEIPVGVAYGTDPELVIETLRSVLAAHSGIVEFPAVRVLFVGFGDSSLDFLARGWTARFEDWVITRSELMVEIAGALKEAGVEIPFPQRDLHVRSIVPLAVPDTGYAGAGDARLDKTQDSGSADE